MNLDPLAHERAAPAHRRLVVAILSLVFLLLLVRTAWLCDDAYITLRTVDNLLHGYGLRWNTADRVQAYTHPLWMLLLSVACRLTGEEYYATLALAGACSLLCFGWLGARVAGSTWAAGFVLSLLLLSRAFVEYSTSGLENPLTHLLLVLFWWRPRGRPHGARSLLWPSLIAALVALSRIDVLVLVGPALAVECWQQRRQRPLRWLAAGFAPFIAWELFSIIYYGFPLPNTAYAKLHTGLDAGPLLQQGAFYFLDAVARDPLTVGVILAGVGLPVLGRDRCAAPGALGILLYCLYVARVGGDFMTGRFLTAPLVAAAVLLARLDYARLGAGRWMLYLPAALLGLLIPRAPTWRSDQSFGGPNYLGAQGIADERFAYYPWTGLLRARRDLRLPIGPLVARGEEEKAKGWHVVVNPWPGITGFYAGPAVHIVDPLALSDALLARLPIKPGPWRIGHFERALPDGYLATLDKGRNVIVDPEIARRYDDVAQVTRGRLWSRQRWRAIVRLNVGL